MSENSALEALVIDFSGWREATGDLQPGVQRVFLDTLNLVSEEKVHLVHGDDYRNGKPCLVNSVVQMISDGAVSPCSMFPEVVAMFDTLNRAFCRAGVNDNSGYVSPLAADLLIRNFGEVKPMPDDHEVQVKTQQIAEAMVPYIEPSDEAMAMDLLAGMAAPAPAALEDPSQDDPLTEYARQMVDFNKSDS